MKHSQTVKVNGRVPQYSKTKDDLFPSELKMLIEICYLAKQNYFITVKYTIIKR
jgi:hypothetical protein